MPEQTKTTPEGWKLVPIEPTPEMAGAVSLKFKKVGDYISGAGTYSMS